MNPNPNENTELNVTTLLALRQETDAIRVITERLQVRDMGPADHIRTKHEVKAFVESGDIKAAEELLKVARERREIGQSESIKQTQQQGQRVNL
jgi:hypothetical protein